MLVAKFILYFGDPEVKVFCIKCDIYPQIIDDGAPNESALRPQNPRRILLDLIKNLSYAELSARHLNDH